MSTGQDTHAATRWDQWILRVAVSVAIVVTVVASVPPRTSVETWRAVVGVVLAVALLVTVAGGGMRRHSPLLVRHTVVSIVLALSSGLIPMVLTNSALVWLPFLGMMSAAGSGLGLAGSVPLAVVPVLGIGTRTWSTAHDPVTLVVNLGAAVVAFGWVVGRGRQREAAELAAAQAEIIRQERSSIAAAERQRVVAAQVHDVLAHTLSGLIITLQGSTVQAEKEQASAELVARLRTASELARDGLSDARQAVATLTQPPGAVEPWDRWLDRTVTRVAEPAGVEVRRSGDPASVPADWVDLARSTVQEGMTNSLRHAGGVPVALVFDPAYVGVTSLGDPATFVGRGHRGSGQGLAGLARRAAGRGGTVTSGPTATGFELRLVWAERV